MKNLRLHNLGTFKRVWVIGAVKGRASSLTVISKKILEKQKLSFLIKVCISYRWGVQGKIFKDMYKGKNMTEDEHVDLLYRHPILIQRPIVIKDNKAVLGRPPINVLDLLDNQ